MTANRRTLLRNLERVNCELLEAVADRRQHLIGERRRLMDELYAAPIPSSRRHPLGTEDALLARRRAPCGGGFSARICKEM